VAVDSGLQTAVQQLKATTRMAKQKNKQKKQQQQAAKQVAIG
jgi:hypothetical protein